MKSTTPTTMTPGESEREDAIDRVLDTARVAWRAGIDRDERTTRPWSERRLARATAPDGRRRSGAERAGRDGLALAMCLAACVLGGLALRRAQPAHEDVGIRAELDTVATATNPASLAGTPAVEPGTEAVAAPATSSVAEREPSPSSSLTAQAPLGPQAPPSPQAPPPRPRSAEPITRLPLPPLPPPAPAAASKAPSRRGSIANVGAEDADGELRFEPRSKGSPSTARGAPASAGGGARARAVVPAPVAPLLEAHRALREARQELARGDVVSAREHLRALARHDDPAVAFEATRALAQSHRDPKEQIVVWDQALRRLLVEPYRSLAAAERARVLARLGRDGGG